MLISASQAFAAPPIFNQLMWAISNSNQAAVKAILENGENRSQLDLQTKNEEGWNPLSLAVVKGHVNVVRLLLDHRADHSAGIVYNQHEYSPLMLAAQHYREDAESPTVIQTLLRRFEPQDYEREIQKSVLFRQPILRMQLKALYCSHFYSTNNLRIDLANSERTDSSFLGDAVAGCYQAVGIECVICTDTPGSRDKSKLLNGKSRTGNSVQCLECGSYFCEGCLGEWVSNATRVVATCPNCRAALPLFELDVRLETTLNSVETFTHWNGPLVPLPRLRDAQPIVQVVGALQQGILAGYHFIELPAVTEEDVIYLRQSGVETSIKTPIPAFKIADAMTSIGLYHTVMGSYPEHAPEVVVASWRINPDLPVTYLTLAEDEAFAAELNRQTGRRFAIAPTEDYYEYAIRARVGANHGTITTTKYNFGENDAGVSQVAWIEANSGGRAHGVHEALPESTLEFSKNSFWLIHSIGNVFVRSSDGVLRGGSFKGNEWSARSSYRYEGGANFRQADIGSRLIEFPNE